MKKYTIVITLLAVVAIALGGISIFLTLQIRNLNAPIAWEAYNELTDTLFEELSNTKKISDEELLITGLIGIPWAVGENDIIDNNSAMRTKRFIQVDTDDTETDIYVVTFFSPNIKDTGFSGVFRQYPENGNRRMLSCSTSYAPGTVIFTVAFAKETDTIDTNSIVTKELAVMANVQRIVDSYLAGS